MGNSLIPIAVVLYFIVLLVIAWATSRGAGNSDFFIGHKNSRWYLVAYGMIGTSLSGVTFMSVPGAVRADHFHYLQIVIGYFIGYMLVAFVLLPLYYRLNLTSIYSYLGTRFGSTTYTTGATFFLLSRTLGACARIYLVLNVLQVFILNTWHIPFAVTVVVILFMILLYTYQGGVKTIVWTDTLQTTFMILALIVTVWFIGNSLQLTPTGLIKSLSLQNYTEVFNTDWRSPAFFVKQILSGAFITIAMTGLDQEMMQKNISCRSLGESQKNMVVFSIILVWVNLLFLIMGGALYLYLLANNITPPAKPDDVFPTIALQYLPPFVGILFVVGLISALFPSADGAMTALTSSFCIDILGLDKQNRTEQSKKQIRMAVHTCVAIVFLLCILYFKYLNTDSVIYLILKIAGYTYAPLVALYCLGLYSKVQFKEYLVPFVCIMAPVLTYVIDSHSKQWLDGYKMGFETAFINTGLTIVGLLIISKKQNKTLT